MTEVALPSRRSPGVFVIALTGDVDLARVPELHEAVEEFRESRALYVVVDLADVEFMDSTGLGMMTRLRREAVARGGNLSAINANPQVARTIRVAGLAMALNLSAS